MLKKMFHTRGLLISSAHKAHQTAIFEYVTALKNRPWIIMSSNLPVLLAHVPIKPKVSFSGECQSVSVVILFLGAQWSFDLNFSWSCCPDR